MTRDYEGAKAFYGAVFGYTYDEMEGDFTYSTIKRASDGEVVGGLGELDASTPAEVPASWVTYFMVDSCDRSAAKAAELGASIALRHHVRPAGIGHRSPR